MGGDKTGFGSFLITTGVVSFLVTGVIGSFLATGVVVVGSFLTVGVLREFVFDDIDSVFGTLLTVTGVDEG